MSPETRKTLKKTIANSLAAIVAALAIGALMELRFRYERELLSTAFIGLSAEKTNINIVTTNQIYDEIKKLQDDVLEIQKQITAIRERLTATEDATEEVKEDVRNE